MPNRLFLFTAHLLGWLFVYIMVIGFLLAAQPAGENISILFTGRFIYFLLIFPIIFYANLFIFTPRFLINARYPQYFTAFLFFLLLILATNPFDHLMHLTRELRNFHPADLPNLPPPPGGPRIERSFRFDLISLMLFLFSWVLSTALPVVQAWNQSEQRISETEREKIKAELSFLKAQLHPHFLFNTLNNLYAMAVSGHGMLAESLLKLSNIMRYITDDSRLDFVPLSLETDCIRDFVDLQKLRLGTSTSVTLHISAEQDNKIIAPLIFMAFTENAFKYGVSKREPSAIEISVQTSPTRIVYTCKNSIFGQRNDLDREGIGIGNTKKRLEYLYPGKHELHIEVKDGIFHVHLELIS